MTTDELLDELERRGLRVELTGEGQPVLRGVRDRVSAALLRVLRWHKEALAQRLRPPPSREWLWRDGHTYREREGEWSDEWLVGQADRHPVGAWWWRTVGEADWRAVAGRPGEEANRPAVAA